MNILIDGERKDIATTECSNIDEMLSTIKDVVGAAGKVITRVEVDSVLLTADTENSIQEKDIKAIETLSVETKDPIDVAKDVLDNAKQYLVSFKSQMEKFLEVLQSGGEESDYDVFIEDLKGWESVFDLFATVGELLSLDFNAIDANGKSVEELLGELKGVLDQVKEGFKNEDIVYLQDLIKYELIPSVDGISFACDQIKVIAEEKNI